MRRLGTVLAAALTAAATIALIAVGGAGAYPNESTPAPKTTIFVGVDTSGSFHGAGYEDALTFLAHYIYGHLNGLGGLTTPRELFVAAVGGKEGNEPKAFHPIHDFAGKSIVQIEADLRLWFPSADTLTDFNAFFRQVARIVKERNLALTPISIMLVSDGIPDVPSPGAKPGSPEAYKQINFGPLEYLARSVTVRLAYTSPPVGERWRTLVQRQRVRFWTVDQEVMKGWRAQMTPDVQPAQQDRLWKWVRENVDFRVRRGT